MVRTSAERIVLMLEQMERAIRVLSRRATVESVVFVLLLSVLVWFDMDSMAIIVALAYIGLGIAEASVALISTLSIMTSIYAVDSHGQATQERRERLAQARLLERRDRP